jgi:hypothetical protein
MDEELQKIKGRIQKGERKEFHLDDNGLLCFRGQYCIPNQENVKKEILVEAHRVTPHLNIYKIAGMSPRLGYPDLGTL